MCYSRGSSRIGTLRDLGSSGAPPNMGGSPKAGHAGHGHGDDDDEDDETGGGEEGESWFAGGERR
jgi:UBX domain-containing protein 1